MAQASMWLKAMVANGHPINSFCVKGFELGSSVHIAKWIFSGYKFNHFLCWQVSTQMLSYDDTLSDAWKMEIRKKPLNFNNWMFFSLQLIQSEGDAGMEM